MLPYYYIWLYAWEKGMVVSSGQFVDLFFVVCFCFDLFCMNNQISVADNGNAMMVAITFLFYV